jgi:hypothetical protein
MRKLIESILIYNSVYPVVILEDKIAFKLNNFMKYFLAIFILLVFSFWLSQMMKYH